MPDGGRTSGCLSISAAFEPTLALSILAVTTSRRSRALSRPVAENVSGSSFGAASTLSSPPPAAIAPGPAGLTFLAADPPPTFFVPAFGAAAFLAGAFASSSASSRAFSALRASSASRFASLSSLLGLPLPPSCHFSASLRSYVSI